MFIFLSVCSLLVPLSMIILGYTWKDNSPKDRQGSSGYRTTMSRMNDETWRYAHSPIVIRHQEICTQVLGLDKLCFRNHSGDTIDFYFDFNER